MITSTRPNNKKMGPLSLFRNPKKADPNKSIHKTQPIDNIAFSQKSPSECNNRLNKLFVIYLENIQAVSAKPSMHDSILGNNDFNSENLNLLQEKLGTLCAKIDGTMIDIYALSNSRKKCKSNTKLTIKPETTQQLTKLATSLDYKSSLEKRLELFDSIVDTLVDIQHSMDAIENQNAFSLEQRGLLQSIYNPAGSAQNSLFFQTCFLAFRLRRALSTKLEAAQSMNPYMFIADLKLINTALKCFDDKKAESLDLPKPHRTLLYTLKHLLLNDAKAAPLQKDDLGGDQDDMLIVDLDSTEPTVLTKSPNSDTAEDNIVSSILRKIGYTTLPHAARMDGNHKIYLLPEERNALLLFRLKLATAEPNS